MNIRTQTIVTKEFLSLFALGLLCLTAFQVIQTENWHQNNKTKPLEVKYSTNQRIADSLNHLYAQKGEIQQRFAYQSDNDFSAGYQISLWRRLYNLAKKEGIE